MLPDTLLGLEIACFLFVESYFVTGQGKLGKSPAHLSCVQQVVFEPVPPRTLQAARYKPSPWRSDCNSSRDAQDVFVTFILQLIPKLVSSEYERNIGRIFKIRLPNDSGLTMGRSFIVGGDKGFQPQYLRVLLRKVVGRSASHRAKADYDHVKRTFHSCPPQ